MHGTHTNRRSLLLVLLRRADLRHQVWSRDLLKLFGKCREQRRVALPLSLAEVDAPDRHEHFILS